MKYILNILDIYGKILAALLSPTLHSFKKDYMSMLLQYLFAPLLNYFLHKCENFYSLFIFTVVGLVFASKLRYNSYFRILIVNLPNFLIASKRIEQLSCCPVWTSFATSFQRFATSTDVYS